MEVIKRQLHETLTIEYANDTESGETERHAVMDWLDSEFGAMNYRIRRSGPKYTGPGEASDKVGLMIVETTAAPEGRE